MATKVNIKDVQGKVDFSQSAEPTLNTEQKNTAFGFFDYIAKAINWFKTELGNKANESRSVDYVATSDQLTTPEIHTLEDIINAYGGNISQLFDDLDKLGVKQSYKVEQVVGTTGTIPKSTHKVLNPKMVEFYEGVDGDKISVDVSISSSGDVTWTSSKNFISTDNFKIIIIG